MTIRELAELAQVSASTVSKIFNDKADNISNETKKRVLDLAREYNYRPNDSKLSGRSYEILLILYKRRLHLNEILSVFEEILTKAGYSLSIAFYQNDEELNRHIIIAASKNYDAVIMDQFLMVQKKHFRGAENFRHLCVIGGATGTASTQESPVDNYEALAEQAVAFLAACGHRDIGLLCGTEFYSEEIRKGYKQALLKMECTLDADYLVTVCDSVEQQKKQIYKLINQNISAIVCDTIACSAQVYQSCARHGLRIPQDISLVCLEHSTPAVLLQPAVCTVRENLRKSIGKCVQTLLQTLEGRCESWVEKDSGTDFDLDRGGSVWSSYHTQGQQGAVLVIGSMNIDETVHIRRIPADGETELASERYAMTGGKGANQAVGLSLLGGRVYLMGCVGNDTDGRKLLSAVRRCGVFTEAIRMEDEVPTGKAYIYSVSERQNTIVVYPGANSRLTVERIRENERLFEKVRYCLLPMEISEEPVLYALKCCEKYHVKTFVKPSLGVSLSDETLHRINYLIPNEREIQSLTTGGNGYQEKAEWLFRHGVEHVIVTLGSGGCYLKDREYSIRFPAVEADPVDTTGAADAFIAALANYLNEDYELLTAVAYAMYAAGLSITKPGVQTAMPDRMTLDRYRSEILRLKDNCRSV